MRRISQVAAILLITVFGAVVAQTNSPISQENVQAMPDYSQILSEIDVLTGALEGSESVSGFASSKYIPDYGLIIEVSVSNFADFIPQFVDLLERLGELAFESMPSAQRIAVLVDQNVFSNSDDRVISFEVQHYADPAQWDVYQENP